jgi:hypothetical protein
VQQQSNMAMSMQRVTLLAFAAWLLKDMSWVLVFPGSLLAGILAVIFEAWATWQTWQIKGSSSVSRIHALAALMWLCGNVVWMSCEMLFDPFERSLKLGLPWYRGPLLKSDIEAYEAGMSIARFIFTAGAIMVFSFYASFLHSVLKFDYTETQGLRSRAAKGAHGNSYGMQISQGMNIFSSEAYDDCFIGFWILKDLFWSLALLRPACVCSLIVIVLVVYGFQGTQQCISSSVAKLCWIIGNTIWMLGETGTQGDPSWTRYVAFAFISIGLIPTICSLFFAAEVSSGKAAKSDESTA